ncbi:hypothetical protein EVAR_61162_1 [Eumeta japonica]|uniref:Uncharacterized protein n=1 Tax=Eumeta variegata TaxID=151549 RepID=A0A4C1ZRW0_EUMVA|nr:hypothetical protein EVAR_61162_1 [Eumeta japonica]
MELTGRGRFEKEVKAVKKDYARHKRNGSAYIRDKIISGEFLHHRVPTRSFRIRTGKKSARPQLLRAVVYGPSCRTSPTRLSPAASWPRIDYPFASYARHPELVFRRNIYSRRKRRAANLKPQRKCVELSENFREVKMFVFATAGSCVKREHPSSKGDVLRHCGYGLRYDSWIASDSSRPPDLGYLEAFQVRYVKAGRVGAYDRIYVPLRYFDRNSIEDERMEIRIIVDSVSVDEPIGRRNSFLERGAAGETCQNYSSELKLALSARESVRYSLEVYNDWKGASAVALSANFRVAPRHGRRPRLPIGFSPCGVI